MGLNFPLNFLTFILISSRFAFFSEFSCFRKKTSRGTAQLMSFLHLVPSAKYVIISKQPIIRLVGGTGGTCPFVRQARSSGACRPPHFSSCSLTASKVFPDHLRSAADSSGTNRSMFGLSTEMGGFVNGFLALFLMTFYSVFVVFIEGQFKCFYFLAKSGRSRLRK